MTTTLPALVVRAIEQEEICLCCGQAVPEPVLQVHAGTIADVYDVWPTGKRGKRIGKKVLVVELKRQA